MKVVLNVLGKNKETQEQQIYDLHINTKEIACLYKDKYGVAFTTYEGKFYRVTQSLKELEELL